MRLVTGPRGDMLSTSSWMAPDEEEEVAVVVGMGLIPFTMSTHHGGAAVARGAARPVAVRTTEVGVSGASGQGR